MRDRWLRTDSLHGALVRRGGSIVRFMSWIWVDLSGLTVSVSSVRSHLRRWVNPAGTWLRVGNFDGK